MKILLVEDNPISVVVLQTMFESFGHEVVVAGDGQDAIDLVYKQDFSIILMDLQLPTVDGIVATKSIRGNKLLKDRANTPIIGMTCSRREIDRKGMFAAGVNDCVEKPIDIDDLVKAMNKAMVDRAEVAINTLQAKVVGHDKGMNRRPC